MTRSKKWVCMAALLGLLVPLPLLATPDSDSDSDSDSDGKPRIQFTRPTGREGFRRLVDRAAPGTTIVCGGGTYRFHKGAPIRIDKPLRIVAQDPSDPPVFVGSFELGDQPIETGNHAFVVYGLETEIARLELEGLHFRGFDTALRLQPNYHPPTCDDPFPADLHGLEVRGCSFTETRVAVSLIGGGRDFRIEESFARTDATALFVVGGFVGYAPGVVCPTARPERGLMRANDVAGGLSSSSPAAAGIVAFGVTDVLIADNTVVGGGFGIQAGDGAGSAADEALRFAAITGNRVSATFVPGAAIAVFGPTAMKDGLIFGNTIVDSPGAGILLAEGANHHTVVANRFDGLAFVDILLDGPGGFFETPPSRENLVIAPDPTVSVVDLGIDNVVIR